MPSDSLAILTHSRGDLRIVFDRCRPVYYFTHVIEIRQTRVFSQWISGLRDRTTLSRINIRIRRMSLGNFGDARPVGNGVSELRIDYGPGYRVYFKRRDKQIVLLLCGGDKSTQDRAIERAKALAKEDDNGA
jgi:putative addiction module killer protein